MARFMKSRILICSVLFCGSLCHGQETSFSRPTFTHYLPGEVRSEVELEAQFKKDGALLIVKFQAEIKEAGTYFVAAGITTRSGKAYVKGHYTYKEIKGEAGEVISGTLEFQDAAGSDGVYLGPYGYEWVTKRWISGTYKDWKDIRAGDYWKD